MLNENAVKLLKSGLWDLAACMDGEPKVVPVAFKDVTPEGKLVVGDVFLDTTLKNIAANNGRIAVSVYDAQNLEGYQVKGTAQYVTEGEVVKTSRPWWRRCSAARRPPRAHSSSPTASWSASPTMKFRPGQSIP